MAILKIRDFGTGGLNSDLAPWDLPSNYLTEGNNFRVTGRRVVAFGGYQPVENFPNDITPEFIYYVNDDDAEYWLSIGEDAVYSFDGATFDPITTPRSLATVDGDLWTGTNLGRLPVFNNPRDFPMYWPPGSGALEDLQFAPGETWADKSYRCKSMRSFRNYLIAMNMYEGANHYSDVVRWSDPADSGGLPVSWDDLDITTRANKVVLGGDGGQIIDGAPIRDGFLIYRERGMSVLDYVGGDYVFRIRHLSTTATAVNTNSIVEVKGRHYFISDGDIVTTDGNTVESIIHDKWRRSFRNRYNQEARETSFALHARYIKEIWFCVAEASDVPDRAYIYNYRDDTWAQRDLPAVPYASYGQLPQAQETWESAMGSWETDPLRWDDGQATPFNETVVGIVRGTPSQLVKLDQIDNLTERYRTVVERTDFPIGGHEQVVSIQSIYPHVIGGAKINVQVGSQEFSGGQIAWKPSLPFYPGSQKKVDIRTTGALFTFRIESDEPAGFELAGIDIEYTFAGGR